MKLSIQTLRWINDTYKTTGEIMPNGVDELVTKIGAQLGAVEEVIDQTAKYQNIIIAKVVACVDHPNADKLHICKIDDGGVAKDVTRDENGYVEVVCGAPNVREGLSVAWLPPGITVPSSYDNDPFVLEARELRGVVSNGMLASAKELDLNDDHGGILEITEDFKPGSDFAESYGLDGHVIDIENKMFTHRPDCFGWLGVARELAGIQHLSFKSPQWYTTKPKFPKPTADLKIKIKNTLPKLVPRFTAIAMSDIKVTASPTWLQAELAKVGSRPINNIVDYSNLFMLESGQPTHAYDYDKLLKVLGKDVATLETRMSRKGDNIKLLNGKELILQDDSTILITAGDVPVGIAGIMGGADTEVDETTTRIVLESANFDMYSIRRTGMKYGLFTDASTRFTKGQSPHQNLAVLAKLVNQIVTEAGGAVASEVIDDDHTETEVKPVRVTSEFINVRLGLDLSADDIQKLLENVEFDIERTDNQDELKISAPFWRTDIEIPEDVVEEVGRLYGYDRLPLVLPKRDLTPVKQDATLRFKQHVRETLAKAGANEVLTYSFVHGELLEKVGQSKEHAFQLSNALSPDLQYYRTGLTASLLDKVHMNIKAGYDQFALFELNKVHYKGEWEEAEPEVPLEDDHLALVVAYSDKQKLSGAAYYQARKYLEQVAGDLIHTLVPLESFDLDSDEWGKQLVAPYEPKRSAIIVKDAQIWAVVGEYKASVRRALKLPAQTAGFELGLPLILDLQATSYKPLSRFPKVEQDISLKVKSDVSYQTVYDLLASELLQDVNHAATLQPVDIYQKDDAHKHMTFRLVVSSYQKTLKNEEVNKLLDQAALVLKDKLGAERL